MEQTKKTMEKIVALAKSRGFVYPGSEIYGGLANTWDYGPLGVELKNNVKKLWMKLNRMVSAPLLCYLILILLSFVLIGTPLLFPNNGKIFTIMTNFGYVIFGSNIVAFLIDYGASIRKYESDRKEFFLLSKDLRTSVDNLITFRRHYNNIFPDECRRLSYKKWLYKLECAEFEFDGHKSSLLVVVKMYLRIVLSMAEILDSKATLLVNNLCLPENFIYNLDKLIIDLRISVGDKDSVDNLALRLAMPDIIDNISLLFPEYKSIFCDDWKNFDECSAFKAENKQV